jgi:hypothetical protein
MGMSMDRLLYLQAKGLLNKEKQRLLDIGPQCVYGITRTKIEQFLNNFGDPTLTGAKLEAEIERLIYFSTPRPGERTTLLSEITDLTSIEYNSFDVCPGLKTEILDLNFQRLPSPHGCCYDVVLNFGTTEHIFNQWNCFEVIHDACKVGGTMYHDLPANGYLTHGYYSYTPLFFKDLAEANQYTVEDLFLTDAGGQRLDDVQVDIRDLDQYMTPHSGRIDTSKQFVVDFNVHAVLRKTKSAPFRVGLEIATAHAGVNEGVLGNYGDGATVRAEGQAGLTEELKGLRARLAAMENSTSWRVTAPLRRLANLVRGC